MTPETPAPGFPESGSPPHPTISASPVSVGRQTRAPSPIAALPEAVERGIEESGG